MADQQAQVVLGADVNVVSAGMADAAKAVKNSVEEMKGHFSSLGASVQFVKDHFVALGGILAGGALFKSSMDAAVEWDTQVLKLSKTMGITTEAASVLAVALDHIGLTTDQYTDASVRLSRQLGTHE